MGGSRRRVPRNTRQDALVGSPAERADCECTLRASRTRSGQRSRPHISNGDDGDDACAQHGVNGLVQQCAAGGDSRDSEAQIRHFDFHALAAIGPVIQLALINDVLNGRNDGRLAGPHTRLIAEHADHINLRLRSSSNYRKLPIDQGIRRVHFQRVLQDTANAKGRVAGNQTRGKGSMTFITVFLPVGGRIAGRSGCAVVDEIHTTDEGSGEQAEARADARVNDCNNSSLPRESQGVQLFDARAGVIQRVSSGIGGGKACQTRRGNAGGGCREGSRYSTELLSVRSRAARPRGSRAWNVKILVQCRASDQGTDIIDRLFRNVRCNSINMFVFPTYLAPTRLDGIDDPVVRLPRFDQDLLGFTFSLGGGESDQSLGQQKCN
jgi:hypothetical protein